ncbi:diacylglycerol kinase [Aeromicrobium phragmitis]|uniref:Diacylglycerol kinase n=1 Tax=Aeromicrobium phragmitis TaxID=2478914 RepID=A0A3L8PL20_9ACTN|nr:diacylglycerol kinase family protein [Aeromicrobium phragmitis]RLV56096.1 diacylglycerol kinase [Aeromicrobium phragmitis]
MKRLLAITNASAGTASDDAVSEALGVLREKFEVTTAATSSLDDLDQALADQPDADVVAALGGDGSLHAVVNALHRADRLDRVAVALVPLGTGNDFARTVELPTEPVEAARRVVEAEPRRMDLIAAEDGQIIVNAASVGLGAEAAVRAKRYKSRWGPIGYAIGALKSAFVPDARVVVRVDGRRLRGHGHVTQLAVGNGRFVGGGTELFPAAKIDDGKMDVQVVFARTLFERFLYVLRVATRTTHRSPLVHQELAERVSVDGEGLRCTSDGELSDACPRHAWRLLPGALTLLA